ncbi:hypothetical protein [Mucisphaera sp.]|uniref:GAP1-N2 domain-containing protein n=1 Tax=Mucisphaera sp. TaxID=2913024 RepID=UPI003D0A5C9B
MAWELVYTSAPRGLSSGSTGFCTVAHSQGLPVSLQSRLEALSGYRPAGGLAATEAGSPVRFSHVLLNHAGQTLSVLSRVASSGVDHSGRVNKLADHRVVLPGERADAGPAWMAGRSGFFREAWTGSPRLLEKEIAVASGKEEPGVCSAWAEATGDAGWAGFLVDRFLIDPAQAIYVVHDPARHDPLRLIREAIRLLPASRRWDVTFSTYHTDPLADHHVAWRFVVAGTAAAKSALMSRDSAHCLDLTASLGVPAESAYVLAAQRGEAVRVSSVEAATTARAVGDEAEATPVIAERAVRGEDRLEARAVGVAGSASRVIGEDLRPAEAGVDGRVVGAFHLGVVVSVIVLGGWLLMTDRGELVVAEGESSADERSEVALLEDRLAASQTRVVELEARLAEVEEAARSGEAALSSGAASMPVDPVTRVEASVEGERDSPASVAAMVSDDLVAAEALELVVDLPAVETVSTGSAGIGTGSRVLARSVWLWRPGSLLSDEARLSVRAAWEMSGSDLFWQVEGRRAELVCRSRDSLGLPVEVRLGRVDLTVEGVMWSWLDADLPEAWALSQDLLWWHAAVSLIEVVDDTRGRMASMCGVRPAEVTGLIHRGGVGVPWGGSGVSASLRTVWLPASWREALADGDRALVYQGPEGSRLRLGVSMSASLVDVQARWEVQALELERERAEARRRADGLAEWLKARRGLEAKLDRVVAVLPKREDGSIDEGKRQAFAHLQDFAAFDRVVDEMAVHEEQLIGVAVDEVGLTVTDLEMRVAAIDRQLEEMRVFPGVRVAVVAARSGVAVQEIRWVVEETP